MRALCLLGLVVAASAAPRAQDVDPVLVDSAVAALRLDLLEPSLLTTLRTAALASGAEPASESTEAELEQALLGLAERIGTRVRAAIAADYRPELLGEIAAQNQMASRASVDSAFAAAQSPERIAGLMRDMEALESDPDAVPLADSALVARFFRSTGVLSDVTDVDRRIMRMMLSRSSGSEDMLRRRGTTLDAVVEETLQQTRVANAGRTVMLGRLMVARFAPAQRTSFDRTLAFFESDAGQYLVEVISPPVKEETVAFMLQALDVLLPAPQP